jgi:hypothetical protein
MSRGKIDFHGRDWSAHAQDHWLEFAGRPGFPDYLRVVFVAYGRHRANGHARLERGELTRFLMRMDGTLPDRRGVRSAIDRAIALGFLMPASRVLCLVVSSLHVQGGIGDPDRPCDRDHTVHAQDRAGRRRLTADDRAGNGRFRAKDGAGHRPLVPGSSLFSSPSMLSTASGRASVGDGPPWLEGYAGPP